MAARLILNADDFGLTRGINRAIAELHAAGALTSATLMANGPAFDDAVAIALKQTHASASAATSSSSTARRSRRLRRFPLCSARTEKTFAPT